MLEAFRRGWSKVKDSPDIVKSGINKLVSVTSTSNTGRDIPIEQIPEMGFNLI